MHEPSSDSVATTSTVKIFFPFRLFLLPPAVLPVVAFETGGADTFSGGAGSTNVVMTLCRSDVVEADRVRFLVEALKRV